MEVKEIIRKILDDKNAMMTREIFVEDQELARRFIAYTMEN